MSVQSCGDLIVCKENQLYLIFNILDKNTWDIGHKKDVIRQIIGPLIIFFKSEDT
jgi:hypothetical protein